MNRKVGEQKSQHTQIWDWVISNTRAVCYCGIPSFAFPVFQLANPIPHFNERSGNSRKNKFVILNNFI